MKFKVAVLQMKSLNRQYKENIEIVIGMMKKAAENRADILLLPEAFLTGYAMPIDNEEALSEQNSYLEQICVAASKLRVGVVVTALTKGQKKPRNPNGENAGNSCAFSPICWDKNGNCVDNVLLMADAVTEGLFYAEFDMDVIRSYRENEMMGNTFRKVKAYDLLLSEKIEYPFIR